jgi:indolepyruvate ferredoxin oxidoreductase beta subunit
VTGWNIILAGIGGQGVLFAHQLLAACAVSQHWHVTGAETHGMSQRGGSVISHLKIGETPAPLIRQGTADLLIAFDANEAYRNLPFVRREGAVVVNTASLDFPDPRVRAFLAPLAITLHPFDADAVARALGRNSVANLALLGFAAGVACLPFSRAALQEAIVRVAPPRFMQVDLEAFDAGWNGAVGRRNGAGRKLEPHGGNKSNEEV